MTTSESVDFEAFREQWLLDVEKNDPATVELGRRFAHKLVQQWRDVDDSSTDLVYCDGAADGGIEKQQPEQRQFTEMANAFDLLKVYGAGWLGEAGLAFGKNPPFLPSGTVFKRIINQEGVPFRANPSELMTFMRRTY